ncbi:MAG: sulfite exporter TauE/SafE family protein [Caldilineaceae bacterium]
MLAAFLLGFTGSFAHCLGMCSGVMLLLSRRGEQGTLGRNWRILLLHLGRLTTYMGLGALMGSLSYAVTLPFAQPSAHQHSDHAMPSATMGVFPLPGFTVVQGLLALLAAVVAIYMAIALLGRAPSPELYLSKLTRWWGGTMRKVAAPSRGVRGSKRIVLNNSLAEILTNYALGLLWGLLPCGLVLAALLTAAVAGAPGRGALTMFLFGLGTTPVALSIALASVGPSWQLTPNARLRPVAALVVFAFGLQMLLRGASTWGWVGHFQLGGMMLW